MNGFEKIFLRLTRYLTTIVVQMDGVHKEDFYNRTFIKIHTHKKFWADTLKTYEAVKNNDSSIEPVALLSDGDSMIYLRFLNLDNKAGGTVGVVGVIKEADGGDKVKKTTIYDIKGKHGVSPTDLHCPIEAYIPFEMEEVE